MRDALSFLRRKQDLEDLNPLGDTPAGRAEHADRLDAALEAARTGRPATEGSAVVSGDPAARTVGEVASAPPRPPLDADLPPVGAGGTRGGYDTGRTGGPAGAVR